MMGDVSTRSADRHAEPGFTVRPPAALRAEAQAVLAHHDRQILGFVVACMRALVNDPERFLGLLDEHWPPPKPRGRPPRESGDSGV
jgi:hypothetical protein